MSGRTLLCSDFDRLLQQLDPFVNDGLLELFNETESYNEQDDEPEDDPDDHRGDVPRKIAGTIPRAQGFSRCSGRSTNSKKSHSSILSKPVTRMGDQIGAAHTSKTFAGSTCEIYQEIHTMNTNADDVGEVLLASPNLQFLGLSVPGEFGCASLLLRRLIMFYNSERIKRKQPRLRLTTLELGVGYLPDATETLFPAEDYLAQLTDLSTLENIRLDLDDMICVE